MSARDPLATMINYDIYVRVVLAYLCGLRICLHCPDCSNEKSAWGGGMGGPARRRACQNKFGRNARLMGGIFGMAESLVAATEHQGNDTPHIHGLMAVVSPQQYKTLEEIRDEMQQDMEDFERMKRFREHLLREDHYDDKAHQSQLEQLERAKE